MLHSISNKFTKFTLTKRSYIATINAIPPTLNERPITDKFINKIPIYVHKKICYFSTHHPDGLMVFIRYLRM